MHSILRKGATALAFLGVCVLVLEVGDAIAPVPLAVAGAAVLERHAPEWMTSVSNHQILLTHKRVIPLGRASIRVPILMYHYIRSAPSIYKDYVGYRLSVTPADFRTQMDWLAGHGYNPVDFNDLREYFAGREPLPSKPVVLTFDDGYSDLYTTAYPVLHEYRFKAVAYIVTSFVGTSRYVTAAQVLEMDHNGIQIASHTVDHANLAGTSLSWATQQLASSRTWLQQLVGHPVIDFAYPSGKFNSGVVGALQATGYDTAVTELPGTVHARADRYLWTRVRVGGGESLSDFVQNLGPVEPWIDITALTTERRAP